MIVIAIDVLLVGWGLVTGQGSGERSSTLCTQLHTASLGRCGWLNAKHLYMLKKCKIRKKPRLKADLIIGLLIEGDLSK